MRKLLAISILMLPAAAQAADGAGAFRPGQWEVTTRILSMDMPGMPAEVVSNMVGKPMTIKHCLTAADAAADPQALLKRSGADCSYRNFRMSGGTVDAAMTCGPKGGGMTGRTSGRYTATSYEMTSQMSMTTGGKSTGVASGRWLGPCK